MVEKELVRIEKLCENCFFGICYFPGDEIRPRDGGELRVTKEFYERTCVTGVGRFFRRLIGDKFDPIVLAEKDAGCVTGRFMER